MSTQVYVNNNIDFRIVAAHAIAQFKQNQAFDLNELVNNPHFKFSKESREIMLLNYDYWFSFIMKIERIFVKRHGNKPIHHDLFDRIKIMIHDTIKEIDDVMNENPTFFNINAKKLLNDDNSIFKQYLLQVLDEKILDKSIFIAFPSLVVAISDSLNNLLFQLQEIEYLTDSDIKSNAFISFTEQCEHINKLENINIILERAKCYNMCFGVSSFHIKNYTNKDISNEISKVFADTNFNITKIINVNDALKH